MKISQTAARAVLREIDSIAKKEAPNAGHDGNWLARLILSSLVGRLQGHLPPEEWTETDVISRHLPKLPQ